MKTQLSARFQASRSSTQRALSAQRPPRRRWVAALVLALLALPTDVWLPSAMAGARGGGVGSPSRAPAPTNPDGSSLPAPVPVPGPAFVPPPLTPPPGGPMPQAVRVDIRPGTNADAARMPFPTDPITLNFVNADIEGVTRAMAAILRQQFVVDPRVKGSITLYSETPILPAEAYLNYLSALRGLGFAVVEVGGLNKVVPEADAKLQSGPVDIGEVNRRGDTVLTQVFKLNHENPNNLVAILRPLISPNNIINASPGNNSLVITDYADNLQRIAKIIAALDTASTSDLEIIPLRHAVASDVAALLQRFNEGSAPAGQGMGGAPTIVIDARSNSLIVRANNPARLAQVRMMVDRLDRPAAGSTGAGNIWVVYLKNADATRLATILRAAFSVPGATGAAAPGSMGASGGGAGGAGTPPSMGLAGMGGGAGSSGAASPQATAPVAAAAAPSTGGFIQADPATNSLIITAAEPLYKQLRAVIEQLDGRRAQVYIESMIVKVDANKAADIGFQWQAVSSKTDSRVAGFGGTNFGKGTNNIITLSGSLSNGATGLTALAASPPSGFNIGILRQFGDLTTLGTLARFLETQANGNVLSTPNLMALDNEEAKIVIGQNVPFITGSFSNAGTGTAGINPFQTIERKDVGLTLRVKPQIGEGGNVRLTIYQENSSVVAGASSSAGPTTDKSAIETTVTVDDGQILVLGGLLKDEYTGDVSKVPLLGDIPLLGRLFRSDSRTRTKTNLMVFLRPVVMRTQQAASSLTQDRYESIRALQENSRTDPNVLMPLSDTPVLPPRTLPTPMPAPVAPVTPQPGPVPGSSDRN
jgi:general secretion pathway protein D